MSCPTQVRGSQVRGSQVRGSQVRGSQVRGSQVRGSQVRGSQAGDLQAWDGPDRRRVPEAVFIDRDGVLNDLWYEPDLGRVDSPLHPDHVRLAGRAALAVRMLNEAGVACVVVSNQPAVAKGKTSWALLEQVTRRLVTELAQHGGTLDGIFYCVHHPEGMRDKLRIACENRKPLPGLLRNAATTLDLNLASCWMVGDAPADITAGRAAGCRTAWVGHRRCDTCATWGGDALPDLTAADLFDAVAAILRME
jgi:D-glycero-D-manno-heptose 1,7-bisphosphate phosphatase